MLQRRKKNDLDYGFSSNFIFINFDIWTALDYQWVHGRKNCGMDLWNSCYNIIFTIYYINSSRIYHIKIGDVHMDVQNEFRLLASMVADIAYDLHDHESIDEEVRGKLLNLWRRFDDCKFYDKEYE